MIAIAERAGVAAGTLYRHFSSKEELFVEVFRSVCDREVRAMQDASEEMPAAASPVDQLETVLATFAERALRKPGGVGAARRARRSARGLRAPGLP